PEFYSVIKVLYSVFLMERFHDCFYNGQTDAISSIFSCMRLIHFIELIPKLRYIFLRNRLTAAKDRDTRLILYPADPHFYPLLVLHMMDRISQIITHDLLSLELIRPYVKLFICDKINRSIRLLDQDLTTCDNSPHKPDDIKPFKLNFVRSELQLVQSQEILHHLVHLVRLIHNNFAIELPALGIVINAFLQALGIPLDQCDRSFQLMRNISQELISHFFQFLFL